MVRVALNSGLALAMSLGFEKYRGHTDTPRRFVLLEASVWEDFRIRLSDSNHPCHLVREFGLDKTEVEHSRHFLAVKIPPLDDDDAGRKMERAGLRQNYPRRSTLPGDGAVVCSQQLERG